MTQEIQIANNRIQALPVEKQKEIAVKWATRGFEINLATNDAYDIIDGLVYQIPDVSGLKTMDIPALKIFIDTHTAPLQNHIVKVKAALKQVDKLMESPIEEMTTVIAALRAPGKQLLEVKGKTEIGLLADLKYALTQISVASEKVADYFASRQKLLTEHRIATGQRYNAAIADINGKIANVVNSAYQNALDKIDVKNLPAHITWLIQTNTFTLPAASFNPNPELAAITEEIWLPVTLDFETPLREKFSDFSNDKANTEIAKKRADDALLEAQNKIKETQVANNFAAEVKATSTPTLFTAPIATKTTYRVNADATNMTEDKLKEIILACYANHLFSYNKTGLMVVADPFIKMLEYARDDGKDIAGIYFVEVKKAK